MQSDVPQEGFAEPRRRVLEIVVRDLRCNDAGVEVYGVCGSGKLPKRVCKAGDCAEKMREVKQVQRYHAERRLPYRRRAERRSGG